MIQVLAFYLFAAIVVASGAMVILARNPVHSVLWLILAFFNAAGLMVLLGAEFVAMLLVIVYVGAVAVLFLFVVMMLDIDFAELRGGFVSYFPLGGTIALILLVELILGVGAWKAGALTLAKRVAPTPEHIPNIQAIGNLLYTANLPVRDGRPHPARRHDRRYRAHPSGPRRRAQPECRQAESPPPEKRSATSISPWVRGWSCDRALFDGRRRMIGLGHYLVVSAILSCSACSASSSTARTSSSS